MMNCEYCKTELSAGDISVIDVINGVHIWGVVCHKCDKVQSSKVEEKKGKFYVTLKEEQ